MSLLSRVRARFTPPPEPVRAVLAASPDADERVLAWGVLVDGFRPDRWDLLGAAICVVGVVVMVVPPRG